MRKFTGTIALIIGTGLTFFNMFNFTYKRIGESTLPSISSNTIAIAYYYEPITLLMIASGTMLMVIGFIDKERSKIK